MELPQNEIFRRKNPPALLFSVRFLTCIVLFFGYCFQTMLKINLSIGIVCMVNHSAISLYQTLNLNETKNFSSHIHKCSISKLNEGPPINEPFVWSKSIQGIILSSYFYGYFFTQLFGGWLSFKFGGRRVLSISMTLASLITIAVPTCARVGYPGVIINRLLLGALHGVFSPAVSSIWSCWAPPNERGTLTGVSNAGSWFGSVLALPLGAHLCTYEVIGGWKSIFYIYGFISFAWCLIFTNLTAESPELHNLISYKEKEYIIRETSKITRPVNQQTPWKGLLTSKACIAIFIAHFCSNWSISLFLNKYIKDVLKFDLKTNGFISAIPFGTSCLLNILSSIASDKIIQSGKMEKTHVRKLFASIGFFIPVLAIIALSYVTCENPFIGIFLLVISISFNSVCFGAAHLVNINDISGPFSGILFGISNTIATVPGIICPFIVGIITIHQTEKEWQTVLALCATIYFIGGCVYIIMCDAQLQPWAINLEKRRENVFLHLR